MCSHNASLLLEQAFQAVASDTAAGISVGFSEFISLSTLRCRFAYHHATTQESTITMKLMMMFNRYYPNPQLTDLKWSSEDTQKGTTSTKPIIQKRPRIPRNTAMRSPFIEFGL